LGVREVVGRHAVSDLPGVVVGQVGHLEVARLVLLAQGEAGDLDSDALEDRDPAVGFCHVVLLLAPAVRQQTGDDERYQQCDSDEETAEPPEPPGRERGIAQLLGIIGGGGGRIARHGRGGAGGPARPGGSSGGHGPRAGVLADCPDQHGTRRDGRQLPVGGVGEVVAVDAARSGRATRPGCADHLADHAGDVVAASRLQREPEQVDRGAVDGARAEHASDVAVGDEATEAVTADQQPVARSHVERSQIGLDLLAAVQHPQDQRAVGVVAGLVGGDAPLVHEALHEGVVLGELLEPSGAEPVRAGVADVHQTGPVAVQDDRRGRRSHALHRGVGLHDLREPYVGSQHRSGERREQVVGRGGVQSPQRLHHDRRGQVTGGGPAHAVGDTQQMLTGVTGVLVVLTDPAGVRDGGVAPRERQRSPTSAARRRSCPGVRASRWRWGWAR
jgi:hypothetical protein